MPTGLRGGSPTRPLALAALAFAFPPVRVRADSIGVPGPMGATEVVVLVAPKWGRAEPRGVPPDPTGATDEVGTLPAAANEKVATGLLAESNRGVPDAMGALGDVMDAGAPKGGRMEE